MAPVAQSKQAGSAAKRAAPASSRQALPALLEARTGAHRLTAPQQARPGATQEPWLQQLEVWAIGEMVVAAEAELSEAEVVQKSEPEADGAAKQVRSKGPLG